MMATNTKFQPFNVVAATDFSELGDRAIVEALRQARQHPASEVHVVSVLFDTGGDATKAQERLRLRIQELLAPEAESSLANVERINIYLTDGNPMKRIVQLAHNVDADLIVIGTHSHPGIKVRVLGSVAEAIVRNAPCGVLVIRPRDFLAGEKVPPIEGSLKEGEHSLKPFHRAPTHHYVNRDAAASSRMMSTW